MNPIVQIITAFIIGAALVYYSIPVIVRLSILKKLYDVPNERKMNKTVIPNLGGIALFIGITISTLLCIHRFSFPEIRYILAGMIILLFIGIKDDIMVISAKEKLIAQVISAIIIIVPGQIRLTNLQGIFGLHQINDTASYFISFVAIIAVINALNLIDGIDGLASLIGILASVILGSMFYMAEEYRYSILCFAITGSLLSFFMYNVFGEKNKIFMGDTGSLILGLLFAILIIKYNELSLQTSIKSFSPILSLSLLIIPIFDMARLFLVRIIRKKSPFSADINHIHHKLLMLGFTHLKSSLILIGANLFIIGIIFIFQSVNINLLFFILLAISSLLSMIPRVIYFYKKAKNSNARKMELRTILWPFRLL